MILPSDEDCQKVIEELACEPNLTEWEADFIASNEGRVNFSSRQKEIFASLIKKYEVLGSD